MERLIESIAETGVIAPIIARPTENGKYEIVSGHRRKSQSERACKSHQVALIGDDSNRKFSKYFINWNELEKSLSGITK